MLDKQSTEKLKGIAILLVVFGHLFVTKFFNIANPNVKYLGAQGVALFLILSGYGLTQSFLKKGIDRSFLVRRGKTVLLPYFLVTLIWIVLDYVFGTVYPFKTEVLALIGFDFSGSLDATMWYIAYILIWYILFYITFRLPLPQLLRVVLLFGFAYLFRYHSKFSLTEQVHWEWGLHAFMFPLGVTWAILTSKFQNARWLLYPTVVLGFGGLVVYMLNVKNNDLGLGPYMVSNFGFALALIALVLVFQALRIHFPFLEFIGSISYEIYLFEAVLMYKYSLLYLLPNKGVSLLLYFSGLILLSWGLRHVVSFKGWNMRTLSKGQEG